MQRNFPIHDVLSVLAMRALPPATEDSVLELVGFMIGDLKGLSEREKMTEAVTACINSLSRQREKLREIHEDALEYSFVLPHSSDAHIAKAARIWLESWKRILGGVETIAVRPIGEEMEISRRANAAPQP